jgi:hypothetical protein
VAIFSFSEFVLKYLCSAGFVFVGSQMLAFCSNDRMTQVSVGDEGMRSCIEYCYSTMRFCISSPIYACMIYIYGCIDILMLAHFLGNSPSLLSHEQNWVPICLSSLNPGGYVQVRFALVAICPLSSLINRIILAFIQAYIAALSSVARGAPSPSISKATAAAAAAAADTVPYLVLISSSPDSSIFAQMHDSRQLMCEVGNLWCESRIKT